MSYVNKYHSTPQLRNAIRHLTNSMSYVGVNEDGTVKHDMSKVKPVEYLGTVKLHGTNASIVLHEDGTTTLHSKEHTLATVKDGEWEIGQDNAEFAQSMQRREHTLTWLKDSIIGNLKKLGKLQYPIKISGEWAGQGVQKDVGISLLTNKSLFVFGVKAGDDWICPELFTWRMPVDSRIYNIANFPTYTVTIDPTFSDKAVVEMTKLVDMVEKECPVAKELLSRGSILPLESGVELVGAGLVWTPKDPELIKDTGTWFKTKGQKHSVSKVKKLVSIDPEELNKL